MLKYVHHIPQIHMTIKESEFSVERIDTKVPPVELYRLLAGEFRDSFILESAVGDQRTVAYSFLGFGAETVLRCEDGYVEGYEGLDDLRSEPIVFLREFLRRNQVRDKRFPFVGGLVGYFSYEFVRCLEPSLRLPVCRQFPEFELGLYREGIIFDHSNFQAYRFTCGAPGELGELLDSLPPEKAPVRFHPTGTRCGMTQDEFEAGVALIKERILSGEAFQVVLSRSLACGFEGDPLALYEDLRITNPSPYMFFIDFGKRKVLGSSPETLVRVRGREVATFPIAGTRPIGADIREQTRLREEMLLDEKERAEHCMLVDLARNDIGKVAEFDSVCLPEFMNVQGYSHVQHIVSKVQGILASDRTAPDALAAVFPAGTVSGAPKPRAMEIIAEIERRARGPYAGGVGYLSLNGNLDSAITIRSAFSNGDRLFLQAGAGIVADSDPHREFVETEQKLGALHASLERCSLACHGG
jgi:anthranilate synthase component 1